MSDIDPGAAIGRAMIEQLETSGPAEDPRTDIDTESLLSRYPNLAAVTVTEVQIDGPHGMPVLARRYTTGAASTVGLVWVHGGAFIAGDLDMPESNWVALELASRGIPVLALDYQKALNGVRFPVPSDEVLAGWLAGVAGDPGILGVPTEGVHLGGASAGANLVAGVALRLLETGAPQPASLILVYPLVHSELPDPGTEAAAALQTLAPSDQITPGMVDVFNLNFVGDEQALGDSIAFPANSDQLGGLPPTLIVNAEADNLRASGEAFGAQLAAEGVSVTLEFVVGTIHGFLDRPGLPAAVDTLDRLAEWMESTRL
ncbi:alpha/beta hydrolase fold domain-containing protein [Subtercola frigoramans]|uniref:Acetyl esterase/lipase n=1 Tax=Subtercola frigoramans TaxID=120298 RepID=A0ABS2LB35_9MICO|nr:alpha/beta hydrolase [Subtercola frigoramans]MBM7473701.1 acetyl esterase/lipase [Subtercola frigoramans]